VLKELKKKLREYEAISKDITDKDKKIKMQDKILKIKMKI
jgi:hypothetical protein